MAEYVFPHVDVKIEDKSFQTTVSEPSAIRYFSPIIAEKGKDNVIQYISGTEFNPKYGRLNHKLHGQAGYNISKALSSGAGAFVIRVLPEDATYAHVIMNIQSKASKKKVLDVNGNLVDIDNVELRPVLMYQRNANSMENIQAALNYEYSATIDGYTNNPVLAIVPEGRGKYYNRYGFRLSPTDQYDETFKFRTYLFETLETNDEGITSIVEGPFLVSLEPDALNLANESLFIGNVVNRYSNVFKVVFNETNYDSLVTSINSELPLAVDPIFGTTRVISDQRETFFHPVTLKDEDVHVSLHQYDNDGKVFEYVKGEPVLNMVDFDSEIQATILDVDDTIRQLTYAESVQGIETMKLALSRFRSNAYPALVDTLVKFDENQDVTGGRLLEAETKAQEKFDELEAAEAEYNTNMTEAAYLTLIAKLDIYLDAVKELKEVVTEIIYTAKAVGSTTNLLDAVVELATVEQELGLYDVMKVNVADKVDTILGLNEAIQNSKIMPTSVVKLETVYNSLFQTNEIIRFIVAMNRDTETEADADIATTRLRYNEAVEAYELANDSYVLPSELDALVLDAINKTEDLLTAVRKTVDLIMVENSLFYCKSIADRSERFVLETVQAIKDSVNIATNAATSADLKADMVDTIKANIASEVAGLNTLSFERYTQDLRKYSNLGSLIGGSDGILETGTEGQRATEAKNLFIKAFKGLIDESILDEDIVEFDLLLDGNFDMDIKHAMTQLITDSREDTAAVLDLGLTPSPAHAIDVRKNQLNIDNSRVFIYGQHFDVYDENTNADVTLTTPYFIAGLIPTNERQYGIHQPLAGRRGVISGFENLSWNPNKEWKNELYKNQVNYIEVTKNRTGLGTQLTSQRRNSALSNINNVLKVLQLRRKVKAVTGEHIIELVNEENLANINSDLNDLVAEELNSGAYTSLNVTAYANDYDLAKKIYRVRIEVVFKDIIERIFSNIVVTR